MSNDSEFKKPEERYEKFNQLDENTDDERNRTATDATQDPNAGNGDNLSTEAEGSELQDNLGGGTNLSLDQLKNNDERNNDE
jgi:hypothetical protein